jgi:ATP-binding cassette, subfamily F, member 3
MGIAFQVRDVVKEYGGRRVLDEANVTIQDGTKIGLIGRNGSGKSTLCRILLGQEEPEKGEVLKPDDLRVGYLEQHDAFALDETVLGYLERRSGQPGWRCGEVAGRLGLRGPTLAAAIGSLPGGWRTRVKLAAMLVEDPDFLVLDEPTNFLDLATVLLLQEFLADFRGGVLLVSHDREFLKETCDHTLSVERGKLTLFPGDVEQFFVFEAEQLDLAQRTNAAIEARREHLQAFVDRFRAKNTKAAQAQSKMKEIARLRPVEIADPLATVRIRIPQVEPRKGAAFGVEDGVIGYPERVIARGVSLHVERGARVAIVGDNGQGKTTLLRTIAGDLPPVGGKVRRAPGLEIAVYAQHVYQALHPDDTVRTHLEHEAGKDVTRQEILDLAGAFLFRGDEVEKPVRVLSGGERARLCLAGLLLMRRPALLLDEPTNHLDFETVEALGAALRAFAGTVVFISHDRTFVNMVATQIVEVDAGRIRTVPGTYADYVEALQRRVRDAQQAARAAERPPKVADPAAMHAERRRRKNELARAQAAFRQVEQRLERLATERAALHAQIEKGGGRQPDVYARLGQIAHEVTAAEADWVETGAKLEALNPDRAGA